MQNHGRYFETHSADKILFLCKSVAGITRVECTATMIESGFARREKDLRINSSYIGMESERKYTTATSRTLKFNTMMINGQIKDKTSNDALKKENANRESEISNSNTALPEKFMRVKNLNIQDYESTQEAFQKIRESCIQQLLDLILKVKGNSQSQDTGNIGNVDNMQPQEGQMIQFSQEEEYYYKETENTKFSTTGKVVTADGREISFNVNFEMSRSFEQYYSKKQEWTMPSFTDPLVINLDSDIASVSDQTFLFDLDADGTEEEISMLDAASGYLALDKNNDGTINDGNELFGTKSGNGFADLEKYDSDGNGWIDEADPIFDKLKIWCKDENGKDILYTLREKGVGAICLQNVATDFALKNKENETNAAIRNTGIFLYENGNAGTVQHLDMAN